MTPLDVIWIQEVLFPIFGFVLGGFAMFGVYRTYNRHLERQHEKELARSGAGTSGAADIQRLQARVDALEGAAARVEELEERVDFAERMLAQREDRPAVRGGE